MRCDKESKEKTNKQKNQNKTKQNKKRRVRIKENVFLSRKSIVVGSKTDFVTPVNYGNNSANL